LKWLADENVPLASVRLLRESGLEIESIGESQAGLADTDVLEFAHSKDLVLLTFDRDFGELIFKKQLPCPPAVVYLRFIPKTPKEPAQVVLAMLDVLKTVKGHFVVLDRDSLRKRALPKSD
jgi:predicted nuclease of predicted toxin-antitoxin system